MEYHARRQHGYLYYTAWSVLLLAAFVLQNSVLMPSIVGVRPLLVVALTCAFCTFNGVVPGFVFSLIGGILMDITSATADGFHALTLTALGLALALLCEYLFNQRLLTVGILSFSACTLYGTALWLLCELPKGYAGAGSYWFRVSLPLILYTWTFVFPFYFLARFLRNTSQRDRGHRGTGGAWK